MQRTIVRIGHWSSWVAFVGAVGYVASVPLQIFKLVSPLRDATIGLGFSLLIPVPFLLALLALHHLVPEDKKFWTHAAVVFGIIYAVYCTLNYVVQLTTVIPAGYSWTFENQQGTPGPLSLLNQTPHSLFWDMDGLGYIFLNIATVFAIPVFKKHGLQRWVRRSFIANGLITPFFAVTYFYPTYSVPVLMLGAPWAITVPGCFLLLALYFRSQDHEAQKLSGGGGMGDTGFEPVTPTV